ncbi:hypothetical protein K1719_020528 [Acacia pycnantha]|nr:hypothetical protein K1719_020528 [Acacia pycnantha]
MFRLFFFSFSFAPFNSRIQAVLLFIFLCHHRPCRISSSFAGSVRPLSDLLVLTRSVLICICICIGRGIRMSIIN